MGDAINALQTLSLPGQRRSERHVHEYVFLSHSINTVDLHC